MVSEEVVSELSPMKPPNIGEMCYMGLGFGVWGLGFNENEVEVAERSELPMQAPNPCNLGFRV